jgi:hypothetical protein
MTATFPAHLLEGLALVAKDQAPSCPEELVSARLAYWRVTSTGRSLRTTAEGRALLESIAENEQARRVNTEIGALQYLLREAERERDVAEAQRDYAKAQVAKDAKALDAAQARLDRLGAQP